jgi:predicted XRE-type DNA-binding protein
VVGSGDTKVEQSSGNVFKDVGFSDTEAERALLKADLAFEIYNIIEGRKLTQAKAGKILGIDPSDISRLKAGDFNRFSVERLFTLLNRFNRNIEIRITRAEDREGHQRVVAV